MTFDPFPTWPIELRNTRGLHGAVTTILGEPHGRWPKWALIPWENSWAVYWFTDAGMALATKTVNVPLYDRPTSFRFGPLVRFKNPKVLRRGRQQVQIDSVTPVVWTNNGREKSVTKPDASHLLNCLNGEFATRLAPSERWKEWTKDRVTLELVSRQTQPASVFLGDKYGVVHGWTGSMVLSVNATARWLLHAAERLGLGSRTAFGFGRIRVTSL